MELRPVKTIEVLTDSGSVYTIARRPKEKRWLVSKRGSDDLHALLCFGKIKDVPDEMIMAGVEERKYLRIQSGTLRSLVDLSGENIENPIIKGNRIFYVAPELLKVGLEQLHYWSDKQLAAEGTGGIPPTAHLSVGWSTPVVRMMNPQYYP